VDNALIFLVYDHIIAVYAIMFIVYALIIGVYALMFTVYEGRIAGNEDPATKVVP
jgi:hypothetical protein